MPNIIQCTPRHQPCEDCDPRRQTCQPEHRDPEQDLREGMSRDDNCPVGRQAVGGGESGQGLESRASRGERCGERAEEEEGAEESAANVEPAAEGSARSRSEGAGGSESSGGTGTGPAVRCRPRPRLPTPTAPLPAVEPADLDVQEPLPALVLSVPDLPFLRPSIRLSPSELRLPIRETSESEESHKRVLADVFDQVSKLNRRAEELLATQQQSARRSNQRIAEAFLANNHQLSADHRALDDSLYEHHLELVAELRDQRDALLERIDRIRRNERLAILRLGAAGRQAIANRIGTVEQVVDRTVADIVSPYVDVLQTAVDLSRASVDDLIDLLGDWQQTIPERYSTTSITERTDRPEKMGLARNEGRQEVAECRIAELRERVECSGPLMVENLGNLIQPFEVHAEGSIGPPMRCEADRARSCGRRSVGAAVANALETVERNGAQGRDTIDRTSAATERWLTRFLNAARAALRNQAQAKQLQLRREAERARELIVESHEDQQRGVIDSLLLYKRSVVDAASGGQQPLLGAAVDGAREAGGTFVQMRVAFLRQCAQIEHGCRSGLAANQRFFRETSTTTVDGQNQAARQRREATGTGLEERLGQRIEAMEQVKDGVARVVAQWEADLAEKYRTQIDDTRTALEPCLSGFRANIAATEDRIERWVDHNRDPAQVYAADLEEIAVRVSGDVRERAQRLETELKQAWTDADVLNAAVRGVTELQGAAVEEQYARLTGDTLRLLITTKIWDRDEENAILASLDGERAAAAQLELRAASYDEDRQRILAIARGLDDELLAEFLGRQGVEATLSEARQALGGVNLDQFNALVNDRNTHTDRLSRADALHFQSRMLLGGSLQSIDRLVEATYLSPEDRGYPPGTTSRDVARWINNQMADLPGLRVEDQRLTEHGAARLVQDFVRERQERASLGAQVAREQGERLRAAYVDRAAELIEGDVGSEEERRAHLGIQLYRPGRVTVENAYGILVDERLNPHHPDLEPSRYPDGQVPPDVVRRVQRDREEALAERQRVLSGAVECYGDPRTAGSSPPNEQILDRLARGQNDLGRGAIEGLIRDPYPSGQTTMLLVRYSASGQGTRESLMQGVVRPLDRDQIADAEASYASVENREASSLWDLVWSETSGQEFLDMELLWMGRPRNDRERAEVALFAMYQQRREGEAGWGIGAALVSGSPEEAALERDRARLEEMAGGEVSFSDRGEPPSVTINNPNFTAFGRYSGENRGSFALATESARESARRFGQSIDAWADAAVATITVIGAVVATVATFGVASPFVAAMIAGGFAAATGLASMAADRAIRGGRYGWEEAVTDLGMTGVQMLTAGLGQKLQLAAGAAKGTGFVRQAVVPAIVTGSIDSMAQTALEDSTWENGPKKGVRELYAAILRGALTGSVAALGTRAMQRIRPPRLGRGLEDIAEDTAWARGRSLGEIADESVDWLGRGAAQALSSGGGAFLSRGAELSFDAMRGKYRGSAGDAFVEMLKSGVQGAVQGFGEGSGEAVRRRRRMGRELGAAIAETEPQEQGPSAPEEQAGAGTAAAVEGSNFRGDLHETVQVQRSHVDDGLDALVREGGMLHGLATVEGSGPDRRARLPADVDEPGAKDIEVDFEIVHDMRAEEGEVGVPVARYKESEPNRYKVYISSHADPGMIQRALVHELTEIRHLRAAESGKREDLLRPRGFVGKDMDKTGDLSPHDRARIAEVELIQHQLHEAGTADPPDKARTDMLREELHSLFAHMGLIRENLPAAKRRRELLFENLSHPDVDGTRSRIEQEIERARKNPRLRYRGGQRQEDQQEALNHLVESWRLHDSVGDRKTADRLLVVIHRQLMRMEVIKTDRRRRPRQYPLEDISDYINRPELVSALLKRLAGDALFDFPPLRRDPAEADPDGAQAVRRQFGDRPQFQSWSDFKDAYFRTFKGPRFDPKDPADVDVAYHHWSSGDYVDETTKSRRSVVSGIQRPDPGFSARYSEETSAVARSIAAGIRLAEGLVLEYKNLTALRDDILPGVAELSKELQKRIQQIAATEDPDSITVGDASTLRHQLLTDAARIDLKRNTDSDLSDDEKARLRSLHHQLVHHAVKLSETLGEAAAHRVARMEPGNWVEEPFKGQGSGLPDVVYRDTETGRLLIVEAKGGESELGTRKDRLGVFRVEQGTRAYLESIAQAMIDSGSDPNPTLGDKILKQLGEPDGIDYRLVKQKFDSSGRPLTPEAGRFDLGPPPSTAEQGSEAAAAVPGSRFHGEFHEKPQIQLEDLTEAADSLMDRREGIGYDLRPLTPEMGRFRLLDPNPNSDAAKIVRLEQVAPEDLPDTNGWKANAEWKQPDPNGLADYVVRVSDRMDQDQIERALVHELREISDVAFGTGSVQKAPGGNEQALDLSAIHGRARLEEIQWLARRIDEGDPGEFFRSELDLLMEHLAGPVPGSEQRRLDILVAMQRQGTLTNEVWRALNAGEVLQQTLPQDSEARQAAEQALHPIDQKQLFRGMAELERDLNTLAGSEGQQGTRLADLMARRQLLIEEVHRLGVAELSAQFHSEERRLPQFEDLVKARDGLFGAFGITPPAHSRQDLDNFLRELWTIRVQHSREPKYSEIYEGYTKSLVGGPGEPGKVSKQFPGPQAEEVHRQLLLLLMIEYPALRADVQATPQDVEPWQLLSLREEAFKIVFGESFTGTRHQAFMQVLLGSQPSATGRVYVNVRSDKSAALFKDIARELIDTTSPDAVEAKLHTDPKEVTQRTDSLVIYAKDNVSLNRILDFLRNRQTADPDLLLPVRPRMTEPVEHGIGVGDEPTSGDSFGGARALAIFQAFSELKKLPSHEQTFERLRQLVDDELRDQGINPQQPHLNLPPGSGTP